MEKDSGKSAMKSQTLEKEQARSSPALRRIQGESPQLSPKLAATFKAEFSPAVEDGVVEKHRVYPLQQTIQIRINKKQ